VLSHPAWDAVAGLRHGFLDRAESEADTWETVMGRLGVPGPVALPRQVHGVHIATAIAPEPRVEADGLVTATPGLLVGIVTADCVPVLLVDRRRRVAAAIHAGWRGAAGGVVEAGIAHLRAAFGARPDDLEAAIGPAIGGCCYEVGPEVIEAFRQRTGATTEVAWRTDGRRPRIDLRRAAQALLRAAGVPVVAILGPCTRCAPGYHSYRREGARTGRQLSFAGWV
jgi:purine-nucleoside/S-methyl-5'-thioadenosine phosphorylase / adenosine deaminase